MAAGGERPLGGDNVPLTHEFLSLMLGVRRAGVTVALNFLEKRGIIALSRKQISIADREELRKGANGTITIQRERDPRALRYNWFRNGLQVKRL